MNWLDEDNSVVALQSNDTIDMVFQLIGSTLPGDYINAISCVLFDHLHVWHTDEKLSFHLQLAGEEGNGWFRDKDPDASIYISRRNCFVIRAPRHLASVIKSISETPLNLPKHKLQLKHKHNKEIKPFATLYSRFVLSDEADENELVEKVVDQLKNIDIDCKKMLCGKQRSLKVDNKIRLTRSLMFDGLSKDDSIKIQANGIGGFQKYGCGVFVPHKAIT